MLRRPRSHRLEKDSRVAFEEALPSRFVYRDLRPDYGIDGEVEEFDEDDFATGVRFYAQLKGTDAEDRGAFRRRLSLGHAEYYRSLALPVLMVRYVAARDELYVRWFHEFDPYYGGLTDKALTFRWDAEDRWRGDTPERLVAEVRAFLSLRSALVSLPLRFYLDLDSAGRLGVSDQEIALAIRSAAARRPDVLEVVAGEPPAGSARIEARADRLTVSLAGVTTSTMHVRDGYSAGEHGEQLAADVWVLAARSLQRLGHSDLAARLAQDFFTASVLASELDVAWPLASAMTRARRVTDGLEIAVELDASKRPQISEQSHFFTLPALLHSDSLDAREVQHLREVLRARIARRESSGALTEAAREHFNLANHLRTRADPVDAAAEYKKAAELDPEYSGRPHYWAEYGGALFGSHRYEEAAAAYERALELGAHDFYVPLRANALMWAGRYRDALELFSGFNADGEAADGLAVWRLKERVLSRIIRELAIERQDRRHLDAVQAAVEAIRSETDSETRAGLEDALRIDALCGFAWLGLAAMALDCGNHNAALEAFLAAGLVYEQDCVDAWAHTLLLARQCKDEAALLDGFETAAEFNPTTLVEALTRLIDTHSADPELREKYLALAEATFGELAKRREQPFCLRYLKPDGSIDVLELDKGLRINYRAG